MDVASKLAAYFLLPMETTVPLFGNALSLYLTLNKSGIGSRWLGTMSSNPGLGIFAAIGIAAFAVTVLLLSRWHTRSLYKILVGSGIYLIISISCFQAAELVHIEVSDLAIVGIIVRVSSLALALAWYYVSKQKYFKFTFAFWIAALAGNLLSSFYLPYQIVDFISSYPLYKLIGLGVFNMADAYYYAFYAFMVISPIYLIVHRRRQRATVAADGESTNTQIELG